MRRQRRRLGALADEAGDARACCGSTYQRVVVEVAAHQQVAGEHLLLDDDLLAVLELDDVFHRDDDLVDALLHVHGRDAGLEVLLDLLLVARLRVHDVPADRAGRRGSRAGRRAASSSSASSSSTSTISSAISASSAASASSSSDLLGHGALDGDLEQGLFDGLDVVALGAGLDQRLERLGRDLAFDGGLDELVDDLLGLGLGSSASTASSSSSATSCWCIGS